MPDGKTHLILWKFHWLTIVPFSLGLGFAFQDGVIPLGMFLGYGAGRYTDPDDDVFGLTHSEVRVVQELPFLGPFLYGDKSTYGAWFRKKHRSFWTHSYFVSTAIRFVWYTRLFWLYVWWSGAVLPPWLWILVCSTYIGLCYSDGVHIWADFRR